MLLKGVRVQLVSFPDPQCSLTESLGMRLDRMGMSVYVPTMKKLPWDVDECYQLEPASEVIQLV